MNQNCLAGMACPECSSLGPFEIVGTAVFLVEDDGCSDFKDLEWSDTSACHCVACGHRGGVKSFEDKDDDND